MCIACVIAADEKNTEKQHNSEMKKKLLFIISTERVNQNFNLSLYDDHAKDHRALSCEECQIL